MSFVENLRQLTKIQTDEFIIWTSQKWILHTIIWISIFVLFVLINQKEKGIWFAISNQSIKVIFYIVLVYTNLFYLIPIFLKKRKFILYLLSASLLVVIISQINFFVFYFKFIGLPEEQILLKEEQVYFYALHAILILFSTIIAISGDWFKQERETIELENKNMHTELQFLKSQINPHFLFNTLNNLYSLTLKKSDNAPDVVLKLSSIMRYMLYECNEEKVALTKEVDYIKNYLDLETIRQDGRTDIQFDINGPLENYSIAPLIFIPFIENAFKHGVNAALAKGHVHISMIIENNQLRFSIINSKPDAINQIQRQIGGIGLTNVKRRLSLIYPKEHILIIDDNPSTYEVKLYIDLISN